MKVNLGGIECWLNSIFLFNNKRGERGSQRAQLFCGNGLCGITWVINFFFKRWGHVNFPGILCLQVWLYLKIELQVYKPRLNLVCCQVCPIFYQINLQMYYLLWQSLIPTYFVRRAHKTKEVNNSPSKQHRWRQQKRILKKIRVTWQGQRTI